MIDLTLIRPSMEQLQKEAEELASLLMLIGERRVFLREQLTQLDEDFTITQNRLALKRSEVELAKQREMRNRPFSEKGINENQVQHPTVDSDDREGGNL